MTEVKTDKLAEELRGFAMELHRRCYGSSAKYSDDPRSVLADVERMVWRMKERIDRLEAALSWIDPQFCSEATNEAELRRRIGFAIEDRNLAYKLSEIAPEHSIHSSSG